MYQVFEFIDGQFKRPSVCLRGDVEHCRMGDRPANGSRDALRHSVRLSNNRVLAVLGTENENYSTETQLSELIKKVDGETLEAYVDNTINEPLMADMPAKGSIIKEETKGDEIVWTLSNGAKVVIKPTNFKDDEVLISGFAPGGDPL